MEGGVPVEGRFKISHCSIYPTTFIYHLRLMFHEPGYQEQLIMIGKMKILALIFSFVIVGSTATLAMDGNQESDAGCRDAPKTVYAVHLAEVEAIYDHEIYLFISSDNGEPVCGIVEILPPKLKEREYREEWEEKECREDEEQEERESKEEEDPEEENEKREEEREEEHEEEQEEGREEEHEDEGREERREEEYEDEDEEREEGRSDDEELKERERDERYRKKKERRYHRRHAFRFYFKEGKGWFLLFPSSHRSLGATAVITLQTHGEVKITPFIYVKNTDMVVYPYSRDEEGHYCKIERIRKGVRYGFEDLMDNPEFECDWDYDDVILYIGRPHKRKCLDKEDVEKEQREER